jgi:hypothetical protein
MAPENYIQHGTTSSYKTYLDPIVSFDLNFTKELNKIPIASDPEDSEDPQTGIGDFKQILNYISLTCILTDDSNNPQTVAERISRLRSLYGYATDQTSTEVELYYDGTSYEGAMERLTITQHGGEPFYTCAIDIVLGVDYQNIT